MNKQFKGVIPSDTGKTPPMTPDVSLARTSVIWPYLSGQENPKAYGIR
jgi:hypothetical protein